MHIKPKRTSHNVTIARNLEIGTTVLSMVWCPLPWLPTLLLSMVWRWPLPWLPTLLLSMVWRWPLPWLPSKAETFLEIFLLQLQTGRRHKLQPANNINCSHVRKSATNVESSAGRTFTSFSYYTTTPLHLPWKDRHTARLDSGCAL